MLIEVFLKKNGNCVKHLRIPLISISTIFASLRKIDCCIHSRGRAFLNLVVWWIDRITGWIQIKVQDIFSMSGFQGQNLKTSKM